MLKLKAGTTVEAAEPQPAFEVQARSAAARPRQTLKHNDVFVVLDSFGDIGASEGHSDGLFRQDTRYLSRLELSLNGAEPLLLGFNVRDDNLNLYCDLTNPDYRNDGQTVVLTRDSIHVGRTVFVHNGVLRQRVALTNFSATAVEIDIGFAFDSDFADLFEVRGMTRARRGTASREVTSAETVTLSYRGLDQRTRDTRLTFEPAPDRLTERSAAYRLTMAAGATRLLFVSVSCNSGTGAPGAQFVTDLIGARREIRAATRNIATVETSNKILNEILCRAASDLYMLVSGTPHGPYPFAGIPWYSTPFGRDGIITAIQMLWFDPRIAQGVLRHLAHHQARDTNPAADSAPGKILHEMRGGEMAALGEVPFAQYYGSIDSTPLFVILAGLYGERTGDYAFLARLRPALDAALGWMDREGDPDGDGFVEYARERETGLANQGWKDSYDAIFHANGDLAHGPIALVEVQGYVYAAKRLAASCYRHLGDETRGRELNAEADALQARFESAFWSERLGTYALALDGQKRPCEVRTSNAGHAMFSGIMRPDRAARVARDILHPTFFSGWGVRTVAAGESRYNPMSYHNGSVWPHDNAMIAAGLARYAFKAQAAQLFDGLIQTAAYMEHRRLPELFCGFRRRRGRGPTLYPVACAPQAWASGAVFQMLQALLGLEIDPIAKRVRLANPHVPASVGQLIVRNLCVRDASVDFAVRSEAGGAASLQVLRTTGDIAVTLSFEAPDRGR